MMFRKGNQYHPLIKLFRYRRVKTVSFLITLIMTVIFYVHSDFFEDDKKTIMGYFGRFQNNVGLKSHTLNITGLNYLTREQIIKILALDPDQSAMTLDLDILKNKLEKSPWIRQAYLNRILPNTLNIRIYENVPIALLQRNKLFYLINDQGEVITPVQRGEHQNLVILTGKNAEKNFPEVVSTLKNFPEIFQTIMAASLINGRRWDIFIALPNSTKVRVQLPADDIERALHDLQKIIDDTTVNLTEIDVVDVRQEGKVYLKFKKNIHENKQNVLT